MDIFGILSLFGGLALFLYGMNVMGDGLSKASGGKMEHILEKLTSNPLKAVGLGAAVTAVIQSSSATTVMVVGFVNSGIMKLSQAVGIIMGANIGTTITSWILSLSGIESDNLIMQFLKPSTFSPILAVIGVIFIMFTKSEKKKDIGLILIGFAVLMFGMDTMSAAVKPLADVPEFTGILTKFSNPILGMLAGTFLTAVIQSSSASVGILQALCVTGAVSFDVAIPIIMGQNIGTCVTALLSAVGANKNAKRAAMVHLYFNVIGTTVFMILFYALHAFIGFEFMGQAANAAGIAVVHTSFNVFATMLLLPFPKVLEKLAVLTIKDKEKKDTEKSVVETQIQLLDVRFLDQPAVAMEQSRHVVTSMAEEAGDALCTGMDLLFRYDTKKAESVIEMEENVDKYEDALGTYLVKLSQKDMNLKDNHDLSIILHCIGDWERISDHALNIMQSSKEMYEKDMVFSEKAMQELEVITKAVRDIFFLAHDVFVHRDRDLAEKVEPLEEIIDELNMELKNRHIRRLRKGTCTIEQGFILSDILTGMERIADHCSNIAVCIRQVQEDNFETHNHLESMKRNNSAEFQKLTEECRSQYILP